MKELDPGSIVGGADSSFPDHIGPYRILRLLGEGGMGSVFEAEQENPRRTVALKVVHAGVMSDEMRRRFELEAQVLGHLHHPCIAQIHEAGVFESTAGVQPYFAMELVRGVPLVEYADEHELGIEARLDLLARICDGVQHAHQRGVIHRDLKPDNILVDEEGQPRILDFGLARATDADIQSVTVFTGLGQIMGTVPYMSPEQAAGNPAKIDIRSDVYSLGVVAYELLSGEMPYLTNQEQVLDALRAVREAEAKPLSALDHRLRGDVETIVGKALEKEADRRYASVGALAEDLRRYLASEPIAARPPSAMYQLAKFARRNKALVAGFAAVFVALVVGLVGTSLGYVEAGRQREDALVAAARARQTSAFLSRILEGINPELAQGQDTTLLRLILDDTEARIDRELQGLPRVEAETRGTIGNTYLSLGELEQAEEHARRSYEIYRDELGPLAPETLRGRARLGIVLLRLGRAEEAEAHLLAAHEDVRGVLDPGSSIALLPATGLATLYYNLDRLDECEEIVDAVLVQREASDAAWVANEGFFKAGLTKATLDLQKSRFDEAGVVLDALLAEASATYGPVHPDTIQVQYLRATLDGYLLDYVGSLARYRDVYEASQRINGPEHIVTRAAQRGLSQRLSAQGQWREAEGLLQTLVEVCSRKLGEDHQETLMARQRLGRVHSDMGRLAEAIDELRLVVDAFERGPVAEHREALEAQVQLALVLAKAKRHAEALAVVEPALVKLEHDPHSHRATYTLARSEQGKALAQLFRFEEAEHAQRELIADCIAHDGPDSDRTLMECSNLALTLGLSGRLEEASKEYARVAEGLRRVRGATFPQTINNTYNAGNTLVALGRFEESVPFFVEAIDAWRELGELRHPNALTMRRTAIEVFEQVERPAEEELLRRIELELAREDREPDDPVLAGPLVALACTLVLQEKGIDEALELLEEALGLQIELAADDPGLAWTQVVYGAALLRDGRVDEAAALLEGAAELLGRNERRRELASRWERELQEPR